MSAAAPLNVVWDRQTLDSVVEAYFIHQVLLAEIGRPIRVMAFEENSEPPFMNDVLVVSYADQFNRYIAEARRRGCKNIGLFHVGDELGDADRSAYANADYVLRHYWFGHALEKPSENSLGVIWLPNGYRRAVGPIAPETILPMRARNIMGFFSGAMKGHSVMTERENMMRVVKESKLPFIAVGTQGFNQGLGPISYAAFMGSARFALVPGGNSPETIRLYDALENGAIPIMLKSDFVQAKDALDNPPILLLNDWNELPSVYAPYADSENASVLNRLDEMQDELLEWWAAFKKKQQTKIKQVIDQSFARG